MYYFRVVLTSLVVALLLVGCPGDDEEPNVPTPPPPGAAAPTSTDFQTFVRQLLASTAENSEPVPLGTMSFANQFVDGDPQPITFFRP